MKMEQRTSMHSMVEDEAYNMRLYFLRRPFHRAVTEANLLIPVEMSDMDARLQMEDQSEETTRKRLRALWRAKIQQALRGALEQFEKDDTLPDNRLVGEKER